MAAANPEVEFHLDGFLGDCQEMLNEHYESKLPSLTVPSIKVYPGGKYYKVAKKDNSHKLEVSKNYTIAPAYNKGAYQVIGKDNIKDIFL